MGNKNNTRLLTLMAYIYELENSESQFIISTHSPILMAYSGAKVFNITENGIESVPYYETEHFQITKNFVDNPERTFKYLF